MNETNDTPLLPFPTSREKGRWVGKWALWLVSCLTPGENTVKSLSPWIIYAKCWNESLLLAKIMDFCCPLLLEKHSANGMYCMKLLLSYPMQQRSFAYWPFFNTYARPSHSSKSIYCADPWWFYKSEWKTSILFGVKLVLLWYQSLFF